MVASIHLVHSTREPCEFCCKLLKTQGRSDAKRKHLERCTAFLKKFPDASHEEISNAARLIVSASKDDSIHWPFHRPDDLLQHTVSTPKASSGRQ